MRAGRPKAALTISSDERANLFGHNAVALAAGGADVASEDRAGVRARVQQRRRVDAAWSRPPYDRQMAQPLHHRSYQGALRRDA